MQSRLDLCGPVAAPLRQIYPASLGDRLLAIQTGLFPRLPRRDSAVSDCQRKSLHRMKPALPSRYTATAAGVLDYRGRPSPLLGRPHASTQRLTDEP